MWEKEKLLVTMFPTMFSTQSDNCIPIYPYFDIISLFAAELEKPEIGISGKAILDVVLANMKKQKFLVMILFFFSTFSNNKFRLFKAERVSRQQLQI